MTMQNIVCIGAGTYGGAYLANALDLAKLPATYRLVLINAQMYAFNTVASLRAAVVPGWQHRAVVDLDPIFQPTDSRHVCLGGSRVIAIKAGHVTLDHEPFVSKAPSDFQGVVDIPYAFLIIATGSHYPFPSRPHPHSITLDQVKSDFVQLQTTFAKARHVLIVGGGPIGVELAGELGAHYNQDAVAATKRITLVHKHDGLLQPSTLKPALGQAIAKELAQRAPGVEIILDDHLADLDSTIPHCTLFPNPRSFQTVKGHRAITDVDVLVRATGNQPDGALMQSWKPKAMTEHGRIRVKSTLQVDGGADDDNELERVYALGDVTDVHELKTGRAAHEQADVIAKNILTTIHADTAHDVKSDTVTLKTYKPGPVLMAVAIGPHGGASQLFFGTIWGGWVTALAKSKSLLTPDFFKRFHHLPSSSVDQAVREASGISSPPGMTSALPGRAAAA